MMSESKICVEVPGSGNLTEVFKTIECLITVVDACVLCESPRDLVAIQTKDLPHGAVENIVQQVDLPSRAQQLFRLRLILCERKGEEQSDKNAGLHCFSASQDSFLLPKILLRTVWQPIQEWHHLSGTLRVISGAPLQSNAIMDHQH